MLFVQYKVYLALVNLSISISNSPTFIATKLSKKWRTHSSPHFAKPNAKIPSQFRHPEEEVVARDVASFLTESLHRKSTALATTKVVRFGSKKLKQVNPSNKKNKKKQFNNRQRILDFTYWNLLELCTGLATYKLKFINSSSALKLGGTFHCGCPVRSSRSEIALLHIVTIFVREMFVREPFVHDSFLIFSVVPLTLIVTYLIFRSWFNSTS